MESVHFDDIWSVRLQQNKRLERNTYCINKFLFDLKISTEIIMLAKQVIDVLLFTAFDQRFSATVLVESSLCYELP